MTCFHSNHKNCIYPVFSSPPSIPRNNGRFEIAISSDWNIFLKYMQLMLHIIIRRYANVLKPARWYLPHVYKIIWIHLYNRTRAHSYVINIAALILRNCWINPRIHNERIHTICFINKEDIYCTVFVAYKALVRLTAELKYICTRVLLHNIQHRRKTYGRAIIYYTGMYKLT